MFYSRNYTAVVCTDGTKRQQVSQHSSEKAIDSSFSNLRKKVKWNAKNVLKSIICDFQKCRSIWRTNLSLSTKVITTHKRKCCDQKFSLQPSFKGRLNLKILKWNLNFPPIFMTENNEKKNVPFYCASSLFVDFVKRGGKGIAFEINALSFH